MKALLLLIFLLTLPSGGVRTITRLNQYTAEAAVAYQNQDYAKAITAYEYILSDLNIQDDQLRLNLAHSYYKANLFEQAQEQYYLLTEHRSDHIQAVVQLQLGNIAARSKKYKQALSFYKKALIADPSNESARYNFELLKKYLQLHPDKLEPEQENNGQQEESIPPPSEETLQPKHNLDAEGDEQAETETQEANNNGEQQGPPNQNSGDQERELAAGDDAGNTEGQNNKGDENSEPQKQQGSSQNISDGDTRAQMQQERLRRTNLSPEKAKLLLDAMRNSELQYIQQLPKKATKKPKKDTPDW